MAAPQAATRVAQQAFVPDDDGHRQTIGPFLKSHCIKCHGPDREEAGFRVDRHLPNDFLARSVAERWSEVLNKLNAGEMPPKDEPRPPATEVAKVVDWISRERLRGEKARRGTEIVLRRLNRAEYNNTIRDLTGIDMQTGRTLRVLAGHDATVSGISVSNSGGLVASVGHDRRLVVTDWQHAETLWTQPHSSHGTVCFSPAADTLVSSGLVDDAWTLLTWDPATGEPRGKLLGHTRAVQGLEFTPDNTLYSWGADGSIRAWDLSRGEQTRFYQPDPSC